MIACWLIWHVFFTYFAHLPTELITLHNQIRDYSDWGKHSHVTVLCYEWLLKSLHNRHRRARNRWVCQMRQSIAMQVCQISSLIYVDTLGTCRDDYAECTGGMLESKSRQISGIYIWCFPRILFLLYRVNLPHGAL